MADAILAFADRYAHVTNRMIRFANGWCFALATLLLVFRVFYPPQLRKRLSSLPLLNGALQDMELVNPQPP